MSESSDFSANQSGFSRLAAMVIVVAAVVHAVVIARAEPLQSANDRSRWCTVRALVEDGTYQIDRVRQIPGWDTIDLVRIDGHFYSTKPPLMATWVAGVVGVIQQTTGWTFQRDLHAINATTLLVINGLPFVVWLVLLTRLLRGWAAPPHSPLVLLVAAWATLLSPFLASLNNHTPAAMGVAVAAFLWLRPKTPGLLWMQIAWFFVWGFSAGWAVCHDLPAGLFAVVMLWEAWRRSRPATLAGFLPGSIVPVIAFVVCNAVATGSWVPAYAGYGGESYLFVHEGVPSYWLDPQGVDRNLDSTPMYLFHCLFGHHGWFSLTPLWLLVVAALPFAQPDESPLHRRVLWWTMAVTAGVLGFYLTRTENYNYGGVSSALRWAIFLTPMWVLSLAVALQRLSAFPKMLATAALAALAISAYSAWEPLGRPWQQPWLFRLGEARGWFNYQTPVQPLPRPMFSWITELPNADANAAMEYRRTDVLGVTETLRLTQLADRIVAGRTLAAIRIERLRDSAVIEDRTLQIDRRRFAEGRQPAECLVWTDREVTPTEQQADLALYRGLPLMRGYYPGVIRYLKTPLRIDALVCQRAAAQVDFAANDAPLKRYRCDVWRSDELPFGAARIEWTVSDPATGAVQQREVWEVTACTPAIAPTSPLNASESKTPR